MTSEELKEEACEACEEAKETCEEACDAAEEAAKKASTDGDFAGLALSGDLLTDGLPYQTAVRSFSSENSIRQSAAYVVK